MTTRKTGRDKSGARKLKIRKETLKDLDPKKGKKIKGGAVRFGPYLTIDFGPCATGNIFCGNRLPQTYGGCPTLECIPTLWACGTLIK